MGMRLVVDGDHFGDVVGRLQGPKSRDRARQPGRLFGSVFQTLDNPFFVELNEGIKEVVVAHGDRLATLDSGWDTPSRTTTCPTLPPKT